MDKYLASKTQVEVWNDGDKHLHCTPLHVILSQIFNDGLRRLKLKW